MSRAPSPLQLAQQHAAAGRLDDAAALLMRHLRQSPRDAVATMELALTLVKLGNLERAEFYFSRAVELAPQVAAVRSDHGHSLMALNRPKEAIARFRQALDIDATLYAAYTGLAQCLIQVEDFNAAIAAAEEGILRFSTQPGSFNDLSRALLLNGNAQAAVAAARRGLSVSPDNVRLLSSLAIALTFAPESTPQEIAAAYRSNGLAMAQSARPAPTWPNTPDPDRPLNIGYLSNDFCEHSVAYFIDPIFGNHDPAAARISCYSTNLAPDKVTARLKSLVTSRGGHWIDASRTPAAALASRIRADNIDILIELGGHSFGNKLPVMVHRPAPVLATYMGWPTTTGLPMVDWRIVDAITDPPGFEAHSTERLQRIDGCFLCYAGAPEAPDPVARNADPPTFGSFNAIAKINPVCVRTWAAAMHAVPDSRMILKAGQLQHPDHRARIIAWFDSQGITAGRLEFLPRTPDARQHLATYARIDVLLDTTPYNGTTTTCESLYMGVPVVTIQGTMHAGRVSSSLLAAIGAVDGVATNEQEFAALAAALIQDRPRLGTLRSTLRQRMLSSPLCNGAAFTRKLEFAYRDMWRDWCSKT